MDSSLHSGRANKDSELKYPLELLFDNARRFPSNVWLQQPDESGLREWTWAEALREVRCMASALVKMSWPSGSRIAISGLNNAHWFMADLAIQLAGHVSVGMYPKQHPENVKYVLEHAGAVALFLGPMPDADIFVEAIPDGLLTIGLPYADAPAGMLQWDSLRHSHTPMMEYRRPQPDTLMTLIYTSGTTGYPKGVMMSFGNIAWVARAFSARLPPPVSQERLFSYLPLAHLLERAVIEIGSLLWGAHVTFLETPEKFSEQLKRTEPTRFFAVPAVWLRLRRGIEQRIAPRLLAVISHAPGVRRVLQNYLRRQLGLQHVHMAVSGAASLPEPTLRWFADVVGLDIQQGYGMTENGAYVSLSAAGEAERGSVGKPFDDAHFRLDASNEIQVKHPGVMRGYYKSDEDTDSAFTSDGWLRTGDVGELDDQGNLFITGRTKDIFKTGSGKYVAPGKIESALMSLSWVEAVCVLGMNMPKPIALVCLTADARNDSRDKIVNQALMALDKTNAMLEAHEKLSAIYVVEDVWSIDNALLTPTLKVRRQQVEKAYATKLGVFDAVHPELYWQAQALL
jgi:long-subunit acyl-CoA synthetase (AMP-forming)